MLEIFGMAGDFCFKRSKVLFFFLKICAKPEFAFGPISDLTACALSPENRLIESTMVSGVRLEDTHNGHYAPGTVMEVACLYGYASAVPENGYYTSKCLRDGTWTNFPTCKGELHKW